MFTSVSSFKKAFTKKISNMFGKDLEEAADADYYAALASVIRDDMNARWVKTNRSYLKDETRQIYYFSLEFLVGKFLENNLIYMEAAEVCRQGLQELGIDWERVCAVEPDAGLGNGGLGRLAACFLDSMASLALPGHGCGIRYKYGLFAQKIVDGYQVELPDNWLREINAWEIRKPDKAVVVKLGGYVRIDGTDPHNPKFYHEGYNPVMAVPYDVPIVGYRNHTVNTLRLWSAEAADHYFDFESFSRGDYVNAVSNRYNVEAISEVLYPDDSNYRNRQLRLKQQYFFVSAGLQSIVRRFKKKENDVSRLPERVVIQINDTHPALAVPELMRILIDDEGFSWEAAWNITSRMIAYTNHTIMPEALEKWPVDVFRELLPRIYMIVEEINRRFCLEAERRYPLDPGRVARMAIVADGQVRMANLAVVGSFSVNGVAAIHTELLKNVVLRDFYEYYPQKFNNKTNGITHRRWLMKSNPPLTELISSAIGDAWIRDPLQLRFLVKYKDDAAFTQKLAQIKLDNKRRLAGYIQEQNGITVDPTALFDVHVKRIHAYKRQLMNALHILHLYNRIREEPGFTMTPRVFIFAGKAAPSYYYAKNIIKLINELAVVVNSDPKVSAFMKVVFLENYGVPIAEKIFPAAELSEQISTASKEASGTSNMKFMQNGAVTLGTGDGANIEIRERVGDENFISFGLTVTEVLRYYREGGYHSAEYLQKQPHLARLLGQLSDGTVFTRLPRDEFSNIIHSLTDYNDEFFVLRDFDSYADAQRRVDKLYRSSALWNAMSLQNIAMSGVFASDNTIRRYADEIWRIQPGV